MLRVLLPVQPSSAFLPLNPFQGKYRQLAPMANGLGMYKSVSLCPAWQHITLAGMPGLLLGL